MILVLAIFIISPVLAADCKIFVSADKIDYYFNEDILITGNVTYSSGTPVSGAAVTVLVNSALSQLFVAQLVTDDEGMFSVSFTLPASAEAGTYTVYATQRNAVQGVAAFTVNEKIAPLTSSKEYEDTGSSGSSGTTAFGGVKDCVENWSCGGWSKCIDGVQTRICSDMNSCGTIEDKPYGIRNCLLSCSELDGFICAADEICPGEWINSSDTEICCSIRCIVASGIEEDEEDKKENEAKVTDDSTRTPTGFAIFENLKNSVNLILVLMLILAILTGIYLRDKRKEKTKTAK